ncbi:glycosyltransferase family 2 protein [Micrococcus luteus]|uniref:glycosyltransferase family 2 protein n=1 Tax=Micrococcus luteus TaxID=1270 RepID=UPI0011A968B3|nr:glycosyltransferase family 2 protein [Micrococcus luteus]MCV7523615.1 glycosyltransferase family 2 protein [Micrococcus luteus]
MSNSPILSVIIPCHHSGESLREQVQALIEQRNAPRMEILLCDNGGNPWLRQWVARLNQTAAVLRCIDATETRGAAYARNRGIAAAQAPFLAFCDDDDLVHPEWARTAVELLAQYPVVSGGVVVRDDVELAGLSREERQKLLEEETRPIPPRLAGRGSLGPALMGGNFAARREVLLRVGGFDAALVDGGEDNDLGLRLHRAGVPVFDCGAMSILYARPGRLVARIRTRRKAGRALAQVAATRGAWADATEFRRPPLVELGKAAGAAGAMAVGIKRRDWPGVLDRGAAAWGLTEGWLQHRILRHSPASHVGLGLNSPGDSPLQRTAPPACVGTTVLVVAYNHQDYILETLESIRRQTRQPAAVLITDDASPGATATEAIVQEFLSGAPTTWRYIPQTTNLGLNRTLNRLLAQVTTEFVTYIAADDTMAPTRIEIHEDLLRNSGPEVALAYSDASVIDGESRVLHETSRVEFPWPGEPARSSDTQACLVRANWIPAASFFMRTEVLRTSRGYAEDLFYEDFELLMRLSARHRFVYTEEPLVSVRRLESSLGATGFAHSSPRFIRSMYAALLHAEEGTSLEAREDARARRWELAKRASATGMPRCEVLAMMREARTGAASPLRAMAHTARALLHRR